MFTIIRTTKLDVRPQAGGGEAGEGERVMATYWITKYALSGGISSINLNDQAVRDGYVYDGWTSHKIGRDAFDNQADAKANAEKRRQVKIQSLRKQIAKLEKLTF